MTYHVFNDGPFVRDFGMPTEEEYQVRRWTLRCNGEELLGDRHGSRFNECHVIADGSWGKRKPVAELRQEATEDGWNTYRWGYRVVDLCPWCQKALGLPQPASDSAATA